MPVERTASDTIVRLKRMLISISRGRELSEGKRMEKIVREPAAPSPRVVAMYASSGAKLNHKTKWKTLIASH